jgi:Rrf2 family protein
MQLGRASALGVFATVHLADHGKRGPVQARNLADALGVPIDYLVKILQQLVKARILTSVRGPKGGFHIQKKPAEITLLDVVEAIEGPVEGILSIRREVRGKTRAKDRIESTCQEAASYARSLLSGTTIRDLQDRAARS